MGSSFIFWGCDHSSKKLGCQCFFLVARNAAKLGGVPIYLSNLAGWENNPPSGSSLDLENLFQAPILNARNRETNRSRLFSGKSKVGEILVHRVESWIMRSWELLVSRSPMKFHGKSEYTNWHVGSTTYFLPSASLLNKARIERGSGDTRMCH